MNGYYQKFEKLKEDLLSNPQIEVIQFDLQDGLSMANIKMVEEELGLQLSTEIKKFYQEVASVSFQWILRQDAQIKLLDNEEAGQVNGAANILDLYTIFAGNDDNKEIPWKNVFWFEDSMVRKVINENKKIRPFDFFDNHATECVGFMIDDDTKIIKDDLFYRDEEASIFPMGLSIEKYLELLITIRGFAKFQSAFLFQNSVENGRVQYYTEKIFSNVN